MMVENNRYYFLIKIYFMNVEELPIRHNFQFLYDVVDLGYFKL